MHTRATRLLFGVASLLSGLGGAVHAVAFQKATTALTTSNLPAFYTGSAKALWLADSATLIILAAIFGLVATRPSAAPRAVVTLTALVPAATAFFLYIFVGNFFAGHLLLTIAALAFAGSQFLVVGSSNVRQETVSSIVAR